MAGRTYQKWTAIGNVGKDPEIRTTAGGRKVAQISLATNRKWRGPNGESQEKTEWHRIVVWNSERGPKWAEIVEQHVKKGDQLFVEGRIEYRQYQGQDGQTKYVTEIIAQEILMLESARKKGGAHDEPDGAGAEEDDEMSF